MAFTAVSLTPSTPHKVHGKNPSPSSEGRKTPHCQTCKKPRKGHPRQGCPNQPQAQADGVQDVPALAAVLTSLHIGPEPERTFAPAGVSSISARPPSAIAKVRREQGRIIPGTPPANKTLVTDSGPHSLPPSQRSEIWSPDEPEEDTKPSTLVRQPTTPSTQSLVRYTSINTKEDFLEDIAHVAMRAPVSVHLVPTDEINQLQLSAKKVGLCTVAVNLFNGAGKNEALLIVGTEYAAVNDIRERFVEQDTAAKRSGHKSYGLAQVAGGAMVGAAAVFAGLAM